jgi:hypothetical protein
MQMAAPDLVVCRCEGVALDDVLAATVVVGDGSPNELKRVSRAGMGPCRGRGCRATIAGLLAARRATTMAEIPLASERPPVRPVSLAALAEVKWPAEALLPAFRQLEVQLEADAAAGLIPDGRLAAARYKLLEENHFALAGGLSDVEAEEIARALRETLRHANVH